MSLSFRSIHLILKSWLQLAAATAAALSLILIVSYRYIVPHFVLFLRLPFASVSFSLNLNKATHLVYKFSFSVSQQFYYVPFFRAYFVFYSFHHCYSILMVFKWPKHTFSLICYRSQQIWHSCCFFIIVAAAAATIFAVFVVGNFTERLWFVLIVNLKWKNFNVKQHHQQQQQPVSKWHHKTFGNTLKNAE